MSVAMEPALQQHQSSSSSRPQQRPRTQSTLSHKSNHSYTSDGNKHSRKASGSGNEHLHTKADPNAAMNESQPIAAALEKPTLQSLRSFSHTDTHGQPIAEPDLSNPTRSRWERPLDTIRSFEAAIDNEYKRRSHTVRDSGTEVMSTYGSRRSSYYGAGPEQNRYSQAGGYFPNRQAGRDSWADNGHGMGGPVGGPPRTRYSRQQSEPQWNRYPGGMGNGNGVYPSQGYQQSRDTVNTNGSNGSHSDPYSNDPSENSSIERATPVMRPDMGEQYGAQGFGGPIMEEYGQPNNAYFVQQPNGAPRNGYGQPPVPMKTGPPPPPVHNSPIKLTKTNSNGQAPGPVPSANTQPRPNALTRQSTEKRKSWFKRRFSKE